FHNVCHIEPPSGHLLLLVKPMAGIVVCGPGWPAAWSRGGPIRWSPVDLLGGRQWIHHLVVGGSIIWSWVDPSSGRRHVPVSGCSETCRRSRDGASPRHVMEPGAIT